LVFSMIRPRKRWAQLPCGVAMVLPSSHLTASSGEANRDQRSHKFSNEDSGERARE